MRHVAWPLALLAGLELLPAAVRQLSPADAYLTVSGAALCFGLLIVGVAGTRLPTTLVAAWLIVGGVRAIAILWGVAPGWYINETLYLEGHSSSATYRTLRPDFGAGNAPAHMINENPFVVAQPLRDNAALRVVATSYVTGPARLVVSSSTRARIVLDGAVLGETLPSVPQEVELPASGERPLQIEVGPAPLAELNLRIGLRGAEPATKPSGWLPKVIGRTELSLVPLALWLVGLIWFLWRIAPRARREVWFAAAVAITWLARPGLDWLAGHDRLPILEAGQDWLTYEAFARDIREHSVLMLLGAPPGQADPFYYQALYPYLVALGHVLFGDSVNAIVLLQLLAMTVAIFLLLVAVGPSLTSILAFALLGASGLFDELFKLAGQLFSENAAIVILSILLSSVARLAPKPTLRQLLTVGLLLGLAVLARATAWLAVPFVAMVLCRDFRGSGRYGPLSAVLLPVLALSALIPLRNMLATGRPVLLPTSGPVNLYMGNVPPNVPPFIMASPAQVIHGQPWERLAREHDPYLVAVAETAVTQPDVLAGRLVAKLEYTLGFARAMGEAGNPQIAWFALAPWLVGLAGLIVGRPRSRLANVALTFALTNAVAVVLIYPSEYFYKLVLPGLVPLAVWGALAVTPVSHMGSGTFPLWYRGVHRNSGRPRSRVTERNTDAVH